MAKPVKRNTQKDVKLDIPIDPNTKTQMPPLYSPADCAPLGDQSTRPHWKRSPEAYEAWAVATYSSTDYAAHQRHPCWRDEDFYAEYARETYGDENYNAFFDPKKNRTSMTDGEILLEARGRAKAILDTWKN